MAYLKVFFGTISQGQYQYYNLMYTFLEGFRFYDDEREQNVVNS